VALLQAARARRREPPARLVPWAEVIARTGALRAAIGPRTVVRIESPGGSFEADRALLAAGAEVADADGDTRAASRIPRAGALALAPERGRILFPRQWYLGLRAALSRIDAETAGARRTADPQDIACMFDKPACHARLAAAGVPVPDAQAIGCIRGYTHLRARMDALGWEKVFVKLSHGSSASGVVALRTGRLGPRAFTTVERVAAPGGDRLYNTKAIRLYTREAEIAAVVDALAREGLHVEPWLPKATLGNRPLDLRVVTIAGAPRHTVVRLGRTVITNLHAGGRRGDLAALAAKLGGEAVAGARRAAGGAAAAFPSSLMTGTDVLLDPAGRATVLEVNAFGDLLPGALDRGEDTYEAQLAAALGPAPATEAPCST
jgi:hypothetical protein